MLLALGLTACRTYSPPSPELLAELDGLPRPPGPYLRQRVAVSSTAAPLDGTFEGVLIARSSAPVKVRLQLFDSAGNEARDLVASPARIVSVAPWPAERYELTLPPADPPEPSFDLMLAVSLHQHFLGLDPTRVDGVRELDDGTELRLRPHPSGVHVHARLDSNGIFRQWVFEHRGERWRLTPGPELAFDGPGARVSIRVLEQAREPHLADLLFVR